MLLTFSHIFSVTKRIYNIIHSSKHKQNPEKNHHIQTNEGKIAIDEIAINEIAIGAVGDSRNRNRRVRAIARCINRYHAMCRSREVGESRDRAMPMMSADGAMPVKVAISSFFLPLSLSLSLSFLFSKAGSHLK